MILKIALIVLIILVNSVYNIAGNLVRPKCPPDQAKCEFRLVLEEYRLMTLRRYTSFMASTEEPAVFYSNGTVRVRDRRNCTKMYKITPQEAARIPSGDGSYKLAYLFNQSLPGPPIVVYHGQQVVVHITNQLTNEGTTIHWHGLSQNNTPWMDGVAGVSQCPINPQETFTYRYMANDVGTFWYHSHYGTQRTMGAHGPLIVLDKTRDEEQKRRGNDPLPVFEDEFYMIVSDIFKKTSLEVAKIVATESVSYFNGWTTPPSKCFNSTKQSDGVDCGVIPFQSGLINGKGRYYLPNVSVPINPGTPIETFTVAKGKKYRFRMICSSMTFSFRVSIDGHPLNVISSDGNDIMTKQVESIIISSGERYDFWIDTNDVDDLGNYWIRATTLEMYQNNERIQSNHVEAALHYDDAPLVDPVSSRRVCSQSSPCVALNCPFRMFKPELHIACETLDSIKNTQASKEMQLIKPASGSDMVEHFLNFHFTGYISDNNATVWKTSVNGIQYRQHSAPPQIYPASERQFRMPCVKENCVQDLCMCTHMVEVPLGKIVQLVLFTTIHNPAGILNGNPHNLHLHGYSFQVVKVGFPTYHNSTGIYKDRNQDIKCFGEFCNKATWSDASWLNGNVPDLLQAPPLKDTVYVPVGGYVVVRFKADIPGYWYMHCHTEFHNEEGLALLFKVGDVSEMNRAPAQMSQCGNFHFSEKEFQDLVQNPRSPDISAAVVEEDKCGKNIYVALSLLFFTLTLILVVTNIVLCCSKARNQGYSYTYIPSSKE